MADTKKLPPEIEERRDELAKELPTDKFLSNHFFNTGFSAGYEEGLKAARQHKASLEILTPAEQRVARLVLKGWSNKEISEHIGITEKSVKSHITSILSKFECRSRAKFIVTVNSLAQQVRNEP